MNTCSSGKSQEKKAGSKSSSNSTGSSLSLLNLLPSLPLCWSSDDLATLGVPANHGKFSDEDPFACPGNATTCPSQEVSVSRSYDASDFEDIRSDHHPCESRPFFLSEGSEAASPVLRQPSQMSSEATTPKRRPTKQDRFKASSPAVDDLAEVSDPVGMTISELCIRASRRGRASSNATTGTTSFGFLFNSIASSGLANGELREELLDDSDEEAN